MGLCIGCEAEAVAYVTVRAEVAETKPVCAEHAGAVLA